MRMRKRIARWAGLAVVFVVLLALVGAGGVVFAWVRVARTLPELQGWHRHGPKSEFVAADARPGYTFGDYLKQEDRVFAELDDLVRKEWSAKVAGKFSRYKVGSVCNPETILDHNWNRTWVAEAKDPVGGALLVHGLSDAPYSLRTLAERLHGAGYTVICLRVPGHGTVPKALADATWEDWAAATRLAMEDLRRRVPAGKPMIAVGYSNGGALCVNDVCETLLQGENVKGSGGGSGSGGRAKPDAMVLISPMIGISPLAEFTEIFPAVSWLTGEKKLAWSGIEPEIDPFKYSSWPVNASLQAYRMTRRVETQIDQLAASGGMKGFPPVLVVQSAADATVIATRMIDVLMDRLPPGRGELILFDINRASWLEGLTDNSFETQIRPRLKRSDLPFVLTLVTNRSEAGYEVVARTLESGKITEREVSGAWPPGNFSLSHVALPIPPTDPVYGDGGKGSIKLPLGTLSLRGERGVLAISSSLMMRMRFNPFYEWTEERVMEWIGKETGKGEERGMGAGN
ncbi:MAG: alpha/beta fold hydrolase [Phycisphaerales bacterium]|nr:alpha/beta fold hydrolase [Planctomycetota bacterium]